MALNERIRGVNLSGWLLMEGYILGGRNITESQFKDQFKKSNGEHALKEFTQSFRDHFIVEEDFRIISQMGANSVRLPFHWKLVKNNFSYLEKACDWAKNYGLKVILDLHAAPGGQNYDWHSDTATDALLWQKSKYRQMTISVWEEVATRLKAHPAVLGYDLLNEPVLGDKPVEILKKFYADLIKRVRTIDKKKIIFLEGDIWAQRIDFLADLLSDNVHVSVHSYHPLNYVFNFAPFYKYPGMVEGNTYSKETLFKHHENYYKFGQKHKVRIFVGEFGINWRGGFFGETLWLHDMLEIFEEFRFDYTYWGYKAVSNHVFPDGLYQYLPNSKYVRREGPLYGWENYPAGWKNEKKKIVDFWQTSNYTRNIELCAILGKFFRK